MLKRLYVDNFRCLSNFVLEPARVSALVGPNGGGKTSVFEVLRSLSGLLNAGELAESVFPRWSASRWDKRSTQHFELEVEHEGQPYRYELVVGHDDDSARTYIQEEQLSAAGDLLYRVNKGVVELYGDDVQATPRTTFPFVGTRSFLPLLESRPDNQRISAFKKWMSGVLLFALNPWAIEAVSQNEGNSIAIDGKNFVSWYRTLVQESPEVVAFVHKDLSSIIDGLHAIRLRNVGPNSRALFFDCRLADRHFDLGLSELSDGQRVLTVLYTILHAVARHSSLLVFDEPDNFVAQSEIQPWLSALREAVADSRVGTLVVISHHPEVIDYLAVDEALYLWRSDEGPTRLKVLASELDRSEGLTASEWLKLGMADAK